MARVAKPCFCSVILKRILLIRPSCAQGGNSLDG
jgi:hypothetical protein